MKELVDYFMIQIMDGIYFKNREEAGRKLASVLSEFSGRNDVIIYGLARGGIAVAKEVSKILLLPLEPLIVKKVGHPNDPEFGIGAIADEGISEVDQSELDHTDQTWLADEMEKIKGEIKRRKDLYLNGNKPRSLEGKIAIIIDDGVATGYTLKAAIKYLHHKKAGRVVVAVPVIPKDVADDIRGTPDKLFALTIPELFLGAVGGYYDDFPQLSDEDVIKLLKDPVLFNMPEYDYLADGFLNIPGISKGRYRFDRFENNEAKISILYNITGDEAIIISTLIPPDKNIIETFLLADTLKKEGAKSVTLISPYLAYMRQDRDEPGMSQSASWIAKITKSSGVDKIVTCDIHSKFAENYFDIPLISLNVSEIFAKEINKKNLDKVTLVAPDEGAIHRCELLRKELDMDLPISYFEKERHRGEVSSKLVGDINAPNAIILDDILDTGATLISACKVLKDKGVADISIMVSHGLFTNSLWEDLWEFNVSEIFTTDSVPPRENIKAKGVSVLSVAPIIRKFIEING